MGWIWLCSGTAEEMNAPVSCSTEAGAEHPKQPSRKRRRKTKKWVGEEKRNEKTDKRAIRKKNNEGKLKNLGVQAAWQQRLKSRFFVLPDVFHTSPQ